MKNYFLITALLLISACAIKPTQEQLANAYYGSFPYNYKQIVKNYAKEHLKDPGSAQWEFTTVPVQQWSSYFGDSQFGYGVCAEINAKNSYGGYTGFKTHFFLINDDKVTQHIFEKGRDHDINGEVAHQRCGS